MNTDLLAQAILVIVGIALLLVGSWKARETSENRKDSGIFYRIGGVILVIGVLWLLWGLLSGGAPPQSASVSAPASEPVAAAAGEPAGVPTAPPSAFRHAGRRKAAEPAQPQEYFLFHGVVYEKPADPRLNPPTADWVDRQLPYSSPRIRSAAGR